MNIIKKGIFTFLTCGLLCSSPVYATQKKPVINDLNKFARNLDKLLDKHVKIRGGYVVKIWINHERRILDFHYVTQVREEHPHLWKQSFHIILDVAKKYKYTVREVWDESMLPAGYPNIEIDVGSRFNIKRKR